MGNVALEPIDAATPNSICWKIFTVRKDAQGYMKYEPWLRNAEYDPLEWKDELYLYWSRKWGDGFCCFRDKKDALRMMAKYPIYTVCVLKQIRITSGVVNWDGCFGSIVVLARGFTLVNDRWIRL